MVLGSRIDGGTQITSFPIKNTIQSIKEIVGDHSESEIYAMLKETNMDPNETTQKLLNQDPFHEVKRKRDKKKEHAAHRGFVDTRKPTEQNIHWATPPTSWDRNARRGSYTRNSVPGISREFRIVRDNRTNQKSNDDAKQETSEHPASGSQQVLSNVPEKSSTGILTDQKHSAASNPEGHIVSQVINEPRDSVSSCAKDVALSGSHRHLLPEEMQETVSVSTSQAQIVVQNDSRASSTLTSTNSVIGVYSSSSDPVHVPSPDSRSAGNVGAIRREVGVVGVPRQSSDGSAKHSSVPNSSSSLRKDISSSAESLGHTVAMSKSNQLNQAPASERNMPSTSISRSFPSSQYNSKHQQSMGHQKATQPNMEWKPKPSQKSTIVSSSVIGMTSAPPPTVTDNSRSSSPVDGAGLSEKLAHANFVENQHVIIPQHLRVPESERTRLTFGTFGVGFDSTRGFTSLQATENIELLNDEPSVSVSASIPVSSSEADQGDLEDFQGRTSRSDSPASAVESDQAPIGNNESLSPQNIESYDEIGLVQSHSPPYSAPEPQLHDPPSLPSFSAYGSQPSYDVPFFRTVMEDNGRGHGLASLTESLSSHAINGSTPSTVALAQQQQQQPVAQMYPQVQISHFPNFVPYRHIISPLYVPPMALPNYPSNPSYPHPSNGSNYLLMPGGTSHLTAGGIKYAASQYKPVPAASPTGYGNYTNPAGFTISAPASIGGVTSLEDVTRIKYKDNNLYVPNPQAESSDIWIQTPRELPGMQSAPYYSLSGQAPPHAAFMPTHAGHASFNAAAHSSHAQYPGLYHPQQPASIPNSHHLVHQQVPPGFGGGVGVAAPGPPQVGTYPQSQINHLNWTSNF